METLCTDSLTLKVKNKISDDMTKIIHITNKIIIFII